MTQKYPLHQGRKYYKQLFFFFFSFLCQWSFTRGYKVTCPLFCSQTSLRLQFQNTTYSRDNLEVYVRLRVEYPVSFPWWTPSEKVLHNEGRRTEIAILYVLLFTVWSKYRMGSIIPSQNYPMYFSKSCWAQTIWRMDVDFVRFGGRPL